VLLLQGKPICIVMNKTDVVGSQDRDKQLAELSERLLAACVSKQQVQHDSSSQESEQCCSPEAAALQKQQLQKQQLQKQQLQKQQLQKQQLQKQQLQKQQLQKQQKLQQTNSPRAHSITIMQTSAVSGTEVHALLQWLVCNSL
jgi:D-alanyl-D-alanine carboxypeptidase